MFRGDMSIGVENCIDKRLELVGAFGRARGWTGFGGR